jgi:hypothetical protein
VLEGVGSADFADGVSHVGRGKVSRNLGHTG